MSSIIQRIETDSVQKAIGPYSQGISVTDAAGWVYVSGQLPTDPITGKLIAGDIRILTNRVLDNIEAILLAGGSSLAHVVRTDVFLTDLHKDFGPMNEEYAKRFKGCIYPARQTIQVQALPLNSPIEISCIAVKKN
jgi:2-iminobutanoate/2-iminopropanoate deaminase